MTGTFMAVDPREIADNAFKAIGQDWMLITAGTLDSFNTMTANWGAFGELWGRRVCFCFIRPHRHTYGFTERSRYFTLSFFSQKYRPALDYCGNNSGRDVDKIAATGLTPVELTPGGIYFDQARLVLACRKLYAQDIDPARFVDPAIPADIYPRHDYHRMYVGEVVQCLVNAGEA